MPFYFEKSLFFGLGMAALVPQALLGGPAVTRPPQAEVPTFLGGPTIVWGRHGWPLPKELGLTPFRRVFVGFVGEVYLHERVILKSGIDGASVVLTPDHDCYVEEHQTDRDITEVHARR